MKKMTIAFILLLSSMTIYAQSRANLETSFTEGTNTIQLTKNPFVVTIKGGIVTSITENGENFNQYTAEASSLYDKITGLADEVTIEQGDALYENGKELVVIKMAASANGYEAKCYLFDM